MLSNNKQVPIAETLGGNRRFCNQDGSYHPKRSYSNSKNLLTNQGKV
ncbi:MAG: hypothetical protein AAGF04_04385 [Chlamydiota bacterium]